MSRFIIAPDSFKGTLSARRICGIISAAISAHIPDAEIIEIPMSDGGEGLVDSYLGICGGRRITAEVLGPLFEPMLCEYGILEDGSAVIEMARCAGLPLVKGRKDPLRTTTYGVGQLIAHAVKNDARSVILGLGGSCTNDCGVGMAAGLGYSFLDSEDRPLPPTGESLSKICRIVPPKSLPAVPIMAACDVDNPLCGPNGAARVYGPQKGATAKMQDELEAGARRLASILDENNAVGLADTPGAGAAGGMGAGVIAFLGGRLVPGIELLLDTVRFDSMLRGAAAVFTGEGRIDRQSAFGKVPVGVARRAKALGVPCFALCGSVGEGAEVTFEQGVTAIFSSVSRPGSLDDIAATCDFDLAFLADSVIRMYLSMM